jgi:ethanolamine transporter EutH
LAADFTGIFNREKMMDIKNKIENLAHSIPNNVIESSAKTTLGFTGAFAAMSINEIAGLVVAILTAIYMVFQIEAAWKRRKIDKHKAQVYKNKGKKKNEHS